MTDVHEAIFSALSASGVKGTHMCWPEGCAPELPWFAYTVDDDNGVFADDGNGVPFVRASCELYERSHDPEAEAAMEAAVRAIGPFTTDEAWLDDEHALVITYHFTVTPDRRD